MRVKALAILIVLLLLPGGAWAGTETVLHAFSGENDGGNPVDAGRLARNGAILYGTTSYGGNSGCGTIFELSGSTLSTLYAFGCYSDGANPAGSVIRDSSGNLYGTTAYGGSGGCGTVFELSGSTLATLYSFACGADGAFPFGGVILDKSGNLFGTASSGGLNGGGVAYEVAVSGTFTVIYNFCSVSACADGQYPEAGLAMDAKHNLYGTTYQGGVKGCYMGFGCGTVFELSPQSGGGWDETVLHQFASTGAGNGAYPNLGTLILSKRQVGKTKEGVIFGITFEDGTSGFGTVFEMIQAKKGYTFNVLHSFAGSGGDGGWPLGMLFNEKGKLVGTTLIGGSGGYGTIFELTNAKGKKKETWTENVIYSFTNGSDGGYPESGVLAGSNGDLYGVASAGGNNGYGVVYTVTP